MAKATATCKCSKCGAEFEVIAYKRNRSEADSFAKWAELNITVCDDCEKKMRDEAHAAENEKAAQAANENGYPELTGTEKQVAWANTIRENAMIVLKKFFFDENRIERRPQSGFEGESIADILLTQTDASFWINNREFTKSAQLLIKLARKAD